MAATTDHNITAPTATNKQMGYYCSCGLKFATEGMAKKHQENEAMRVFNQPEPAEKETPMTETPTPEDQEKTAKAVGKLQEAQKKADGPKQPTEAIEGELVESKSNGSNLAEQISSMDTAQKMVLKYATSIINQEQAAEFQTRMMLIQRLNPKLAQCSPQSMFTAMMACVNLQLMPNTTEQLAHIIPYWDKDTRSFEAQFQPGYKGLAELAYRTGKVVKIDQEAAFKGDEFSWELGLERKLTHKPDPTVDRTKYDDIIATYATVKLTNGEVLFEVVTKPEIDKIKSKAQSQNGPWKDWPVEQAKKTATKRLTKLLPGSKEDNRLKLAVELDNLAEAGKRITIDAETGEISALDSGRLAPEIEAQLAATTSRDEVNAFLQSLSVADRKKVAALASDRLKELA